MGVVRIDQAHIALVPDLMSAADDVVDDVGITRVEAPHALNARTILGYKFGEVAALYLENVGCLVLHSRLIVRFG
jgi:hypothetical protein